MTVQPVTNTQTLTADRSWLASLHAEQYSIPPNVSPWTSLSVAKGLP